jgi:hypothetical protein
MISRGATFLLLMSWKFIGGYSITPKSPIHVMFHIFGFNFSYYCKQFIEVGSSKIFIMIRTSWF